LNFLTKEDTMPNYFTEQTNFYGNMTPFTLVEEYGSPLYVYNEAILRTRCREMAGLVSYPRFKVNYSIKANSNLELLKIVRGEGLAADAMSPGEIHALLAAGFRAEEIFYVGNNVSEAEMNFAIDRSVLVSVDSLPQLIQFGRLNPGGRVAVRFNPGVGVGHHEKVMTGGKKTKFGIYPELANEVKKIAADTGLQIVGINQHIGSLFLEGAVYLEGVKSLLDIARQFDSLEFVDIGGGFGIPYYKQAGQARLDLRMLGESLDGLFRGWVRDCGREIEFRIEPGRYIVAECGVLLGTVYAVKENYGTFYVGTDLGMNVLIRPAMYEAHHELEVYRRDETEEPGDSKRVTVVGNICETGDIIARDRELPETCEGDILGVMDAGAYGYSMCSNYNNRLRPAEVLIREDGSPALIRRRDTLEDLLRNF
jgi:diaminopimelate decarboxylase